LLRPYIPDTNYISIPLAYVKSSSSLSIPSTNGRLEYDVTDPLTIEYTYYVSYGVI